MKAARFVIVVLGLLAALLWEVPRRRPLAPARVATQSTTPGAAKFASASGGAIDFKEALESLGDTRSRKDRATLLQRWTQADPHAAMRFAQNRAEAEEQMADGMEVFRAWIKSDFAGAARWFEDQSPTPLQQQAREILAEALSEVEPNDVLAWLAQSSGRKELYGPVFRAWTEKDPMLAAREAQQLGPGSFRADLLGQVAARWASFDPAAAIQWARTLEGDSHPALLAVSDAWAATDPTAAATFASRQQDSALLEAVVAKWAESAPEAAGPWALTLPDAELRARLLAKACAIWTQRDPAAAANFVARLKDDSQASAAMAVVAAGSYSQPEFIANWVGKFPDHSLKEDAIGAILAAWGANDPTRAAAWLRAIGRAPSP